MPFGGLYPPALVLHHATTVGLSDAQVAKLKQDLLETELKVVDLRARAERARLETAKLLAAPKVDQAAVGRKIDDGAAAKAEIQKARLGLLLRTRDSLSEEQRAKLDQLFKGQRGPRGERDRGAPQGRGRDGDPGRPSGPHRM